MQQLQQPLADSVGSHLASKHPLAFYQLLDLGARSDHGQQLQQIMYKVSHLLQLLADGSSGTGTAQLAMLLQQPANVAALGSVLCSTIKAVTSCLDTVIVGSVPAAAGSYQQQQVQAVVQPLQTQQQQQQGALPTYAVVQGVKATSGQGLNKHLHPAGHGQGGILRQLSKSLLLALQQALLPSAAADTTSSSSDKARRDSSCIQQAASSATFLLVLLSRGLLAVHQTVLGMSAADAAAFGFDKAVTAADFSVSSDAVFTDIASQSAGDSVLFVLESLEVFRDVYGMLKLCLQPQLVDVTSKPAAAATSCTGTDCQRLTALASSSRSSSSSNNNNKSTGADSRPGNISSGSGTARYSAEDILLEWFTTAWCCKKWQQLLKQRIIKCHVAASAAAAAAMATKAYAGSTCCGCGNHASWQQSWQSLTVAGAWITC
jgi:Ca2+-binding RTX toxin-like protein